MAFPSPPWTLNGQAWVSLFYATPPASLDPTGEGLGVYAAAYTSFETGSTIPHRALVVARRVRDGDGRAYRVVDGWTDAAAAVEGYGSLFGYPVRVGSLDGDLGGLGPVSRSEWTATGVAGAQFADTAGIALRTPLTVVTRQPRTQGTVATADAVGLRSIHALPGGVERARRRPARVAGPQAAVRVVPRPRREAGARLTRRGHPE